MTPAEQRIHLTENLRDLHMPTDSLWWPLATGWWVIVAIATILALLLINHLLQKLLQRSRRRHDNTDKQLLAACYRAWQSDANNTAYIHCVSTQLRKAAIGRAGRSTVAGLSGSAWVQWLEHTSGHQFSSATRTLLGRGLYDTNSPPPDPHIHDELVHCFEQLSHSSNDAIRLSVLKSESMSTGNA